MGRLALLSAGSILLAMMTMSISGIRWCELLLTVIFRDLLVSDRDPGRGPWQRAESYHDALGRKPFLDYAPPFSIIHILSLIALSLALTYALRVARKNHVPLTIALLALCVGIGVLDQNFVVVDWMSYMRIAICTVLVGYLVFARSKNEVVSSKVSSLTKAEGTSKEAADNDGL